MDYDMYDIGFTDGYHQALEDVFEKVKEHYKFFKTMPSITLFKEMLDELPKGE